MMHTGGQVKQREYGRTAVFLNSVTAAYGRHVAMENVTLSVHRGDFLGIIGPNGAGKTTLLTVVNGLAKVISGNAQILGEPLSRKNVNALRKKIGYVPQIQEIDPLLPINVRDSVLVGCYGRLGFFRRVPKALLEKTETLLGLVGLSRLGDRPLGHLSGGEKQRVAIARALLQEPEILLLDEPCASLDWKAQKEILVLIQELHNRLRLTTLMVTHDLNSLPQVCTRMAFMKGGRLIWEGEAAQALSGSRLSELYDTGITIASHEGKPVLLY